jgi:hypothetical protein
MMRLRPGVKMLLAVMLLEAWILVLVVLWLLFH